MWESKALKVLKSIEVQGRPDGILEFTGMGPFLIDRAHTSGARSARGFHADRVWCLRRATSHER